METPSDERLLVRVPDRDLTLAKIALRGEAESKILERYGLDFWLRGDRTLGNACRERGLDPGALERELEAASPLDVRPSLRDWWTAPLNDVLTRVIEGHHAFARAMLANLQGLVSRVVARHGQAHPELVVVEHLVAALHDDLIPHLVREERVLFPFIRQALGIAPSPPPLSDPAHPTRTMLDQHTTTGRLLEELVDATARFEPPPTASSPFVQLYRDLATFRHDLLLHMTLEENVLFPRALGFSRIDTLFPHEG